jgi:hypothetical protein
MNYRDFRPKTIIFTALLVFLSLSFMSAIDLLNSLIMWSITDTRKFMEINLVKIGAVGIPAIAIFSAWLYRYMTPVHAALSALSAGKKSATTCEPRRCSTFAGQGETLSRRTSASTA